jgi:hypothetical protein
VRLLLAPLGLALVATALVDVLSTTIAVNRGAGPVTGRLAHALWTRVLVRHRRRTSHQLIWYGGISVVLGTLATWLVLTVVGWVLVFAAGDGAVVHVADDAAASLADRAYFAGYSVFTLGNGDLRPNGAWAQLATTAAAASGLFLASLAVSYIIPVVAAAGEKRQVAGYISSIGESPDELLLGAWDGQSFGRLDDHLIALTPMVGLAGQRYLSYPTLHYFHSTERLGALAPSVAALDESMTMLAHGVAPEVRPDAVALRPARGAVLELLETLHRAFIEPAEQVPPVPSLARLRQAGIPTVTDAEFAEAVAGVEKRRRLLLALVEADGWVWEAVVAPGGPQDPTVEDTIEPGREEVG